MSQRRCCSLPEWVRLRLLDPGSVSEQSGGEDGGERMTGRWIVGAYSAAAVGNGLELSYAAGYPEAQDLFLADTAECDPATGDILADEAGNPVLRGIALLVRWEQVAYLEFIERIG